MAVFEYAATTQAGRRMKGTLDAASADEAVAELARMGLAVQSTSPAARQPSHRITRSEFMLFNQQLASLAQTGVPLERGLRELSADAASPRLRATVLALADDLDHGTPLDQAVERRRGDFPPMYAAILRAGVATGRLGDMLLAFNRHLEWATQLRRIIWEALAYPLTVLFLACIVMTGVYAFVVPQLEVLTSSLGSNTPIVTRAVYAASHHVGDFWIAVAAIMVICVAAVLALRRSPGGKAFVESVVLRIPMAGPLLRASLLSRLTDSLAVMVQAGYGLPECFRTAAATVGSEGIALQCDRLAAAIERGERLGDAHAAAPGAVPAMVLFAMQAGADRNELPESLYTLSEMYASQARSRQAALQGALLPVVIVILGVFIGAAIVGMFLPVTTMLNLMQK